MASALTQTFYDLNTSTIHPYPASSYPPPASWSPGDGNGGPGGRVDGQQGLVPGVTAGQDTGGPTHIPPKGDWLDEDDGGGEESGGDGERTTDASCHRHSQVAATLTWLTDNYERAEGVCLPRCVLYTHYLDFCKRHDFTPAGAATFGKIIRQKFPKLTTRRLGTRGQSKYHYYGIGIKESSVYYHSVYSGRGLTRFSGVKVKTEGSNRKYSLSSKTGTLLPEFPDVDNLILPDDVSSDKMQTLLVMYKTHCQRILDTIISANFDEVQNLLLHFWQGMPDHLTDVLTSDVLGDIIQLCDSVLYKVLADVLLPSSIQDMPDSLAMEIKVFARKLPLWLDSALDTVPLCLRDRKMQAARSFSRSVSRQLSFVQLAQTARGTLTSQEEVVRMTSDLGRVDVGQVLSQALYTQPSVDDVQQHAAVHFFLECRGLLEKQAPVEAYTEWVDTIVDSCVLQPCKEKGREFRDSAADFLMQWTLVGSLLMKEMTLLNCQSFGSLHVVHVMLDEYVYLVMETQRDQARDLHLQQLVQRHMKNAEAIKTQAKIRTGANKIASASPKNRKRKQEEQADSGTDEMEVTSQANDVRADCTSSSAPSAACLEEAVASPYHTAFTRPPPSAARDPLYSQPEDGGERAAHAYPGVSGGGVTYERGSYLPGLPLGPYPDYSRLHPYPDPHPAPQPFHPTPSLGGGGGVYWSEPGAAGREAYPGYGYGHGYADSYKNAALLRGSMYSHDPGLGLGPSRSYLTPDTIQGPALAVGSAYGANFMEIASPAAQYPRPDALAPGYHDDLYPPGGAFHKHYIASSFR